MGEVVHLSLFRRERAILSMEEHIAALVALLPLAPDLEGEILRLRHEIWLIQTECNVRQAETDVPNLRRG